MLLLAYLFSRTQVRCTHVSRFVCHKRNDGNLNISLGSQAVPKNSVSPPVTIVSFRGFAAVTFASLASCAGMLPVILITRPPPPSANAVLHQPPAGIPFTFCGVAASIFESQCLCLPNFSFALRCGAHMCPDLCVITVKKTSILVPSLTQQNKGVQPDCLKLLELPSQRVGQGEPFRRFPFSLPTARFIRVPRKPRFEQAVKQRGFLMVCR